MEYVINPELAQERVHVSRGETVYL
jgi:hypothetical protein